MDILKAFSLLDTEYQINIQGTLEDPLFQANQIGKLLGISNIRDTVKEFSENEKGVGLTDTLGGKQETIFLTEYGYNDLCLNEINTASHYNELQEKERILDIFETFK